MTTTITTLNAAEMNLIAGGVIEGPDGQGCTDPRLPTRDTLGQTLQGGPTYVGGLGN
jgi:hypothetical protein